MRLRYIPAVVIHGDEEKQEYKKPADWAYMEQSGEVLRNIPDTWRQYPDSEAGRMSVIDMEYNELKNARTTEEIKRELVHLGSATLHLWRKLSNVADN